jgi:hypothetical protein
LCWKSSSPTMHRQANARSNYEPSTRLSFDCYLAVPFALRNANRPDSVDSTYSDLLSTLLPFDAEFLTVALWLMPALSNHPIRPR